MRLYRMILSPTGGTEKVANALSCGWDREQGMVNLLEVDRDYGVYKLKVDDVCIVAVPSFGGRAPTVALERLSSMKGNQARAVLTTMYGGRDFEDTLLELKDMLEVAGFRCVAAVAMITKHFTTHQFAMGRPDEKDVTQLKTFMEQVREKLKEDKVQEPVFVSGNRPYRKYSGVSLRSKADKTCRQCGVCIRECPVHTIPREGMTRTDEDMHISCMCYTVICPNGSRKLNRAIVNVVAQRLKGTCAEPKQNKLFS